MKAFANLLSARSLLSLLPVASATFVPHRHVHMKREDCSLAVNYTQDLERLFHGNQNFIKDMSKTNPSLLYDLAVDGQQPPFLLFDCSDSRVNEQGIFAAAPGTLFTSGNIANQYQESDLNANAVLSYAVDSLKVKHIIVMGHYGCGGVAASMMPPPDPTDRHSHIIVNDWITPIRNLYDNSVRPEIAVHREKARRAPASSPPDLRDPAFRAMVEENVKANVQRLYNSTIVQQHFTSLDQSEIIDCPSNPVADLYIHGLVYDVETGKVSDLGVTVGPPGRPIPPTPFPALNTTHT